ncbi:Uncharacterised protein [Vibrio cholerae]|nr:Uncharacterised protein [Vibrio cholerae]
MPIRMLHLLKWLRRWIQLLLLHTVLHRVL